MASPPGCRLAGLSYCFSPEEGDKPEYQHGYWPDDQQPVPEQDLRPLHSIRQISQGNEDNGQDQTEQEDVGQDLGLVTRKQTRNFARLKGKAGESQNEDPGSKRQQEQRPGNQQQSDQDGNLKEGRQAADPG